MMKLFQANGIYIAVMKAGGITKPEFIFRNRMSFLNRGRIILNVLFTLAAHGILIHVYLLNLYIHLKNLK